MTYAIVFPGQGAQTVGMGKGFIERYPSAAEVFDRSDEALGFSLSRIILEGPDEELKKTEYAQPAILATSMAIFSVLENEKKLSLKPRFVAGHSLGEYTALVAAGTLSLEDGVRLVNLRGRLMQEAVPIGEGSMAAIMGIDRQTVTAICSEASELGVCQAANFNAPAQTVISGQVEAVERAMVLARERGARRALPLNVSAPFHSSLMRPVADKLRRAFLDCEWKEPRWPLVANVSAEPEETVENIQQSLYDQTFMPVLWADSVDLMKNRGVSGFVEVGPGAVLSGLIRRIWPEAACLSLNAPDGLDQVIDFVEGGQ